MLNFKILELHKNINTKSEKNFNLKFCRNRSNDRDDLFYFEEGGI